MNNKKIMWIFAAVALLVTVSASFAIPMMDGQYTQGTFEQNDVLASVSGIDEARGDTSGLIDDFKKDFLENERYKYLWTGLKNTLMITVISLVIGLVLGILVAIIRSVHDLRGEFYVLNAICKVYTTVIRGTPVLVQLLIIYYVIFATASIGQIWIAALAFGINSGAYVAEIVRAGINSVPKGQLEASSSLGMPFTASMIFVILPQAVRNILPALCNEGISLLKETSISGYIGLMDITKGGDLIRAQTYDALLPLIVVAAIYLVIVLFITSLVHKLERRLNNAY